MERAAIEAITGNEISRLTGENPSEELYFVFRRPTVEDETDRIGRRLVRRMLEAGVVEPL